MSPMIRFLLVQLALGAAVGTAILAAFLAAGGPVLRAMLSEAMEQPDQLLPIWIGAVAPFAVGFLATALAFGGRSGDDGRQAGGPQSPLRPVRLRSVAPADRRRR